MFSSQRGFIPIIAIIFIAIASAVVIKTNPTLVQKITQNFNKIASPGPTAVDTHALPSPSAGPAATGKATKTATPTPAASKSSATSTSSSSSNSSGSSNGSASTSAPTATPTPTPVPTATPQAGDYVKVNSPNGGQTFNSGDQITISWEANNFGTFYVYVVDNQQTATTVTTDYSGNLSGSISRSYTWTINLGSGTTTQFRVRIAAYKLGQSGFGEDYSDNYFTINR